MNRKDWRTISAHTIAFDPEEMANRLLPIIHTKTLADHESTQEYGTRLVEECRSAMARVLPFANAETEFLNLLLDKGVIEPRLLTNDPDLQQRIKKQPLLEWKALNVRRHKGIS
ncbi:MAG: hypothetical protein K9L68_13460 [Spirochaetales bacterium]|nr:hypothetical protein [Spirochaetales bacterium]MCF7939599.1 hypothetical protein [Spirochaetales bacterium]